VSRWLGEKLLSISKDDTASRWQRIFRYACDMLLDGGFALLCLVGLAWSIPRIINAFDSGFHALTDRSLFVIGDYLCTAAKAPLTDGLWATAMLFSTLLPTAVHFAFLLFAPFLWRLTPNETNRTRADHLLHGWPPPKCDVVGWAKEKVDELWPTPAPANTPRYGLAEDQAIFDGTVNDTTLHAIAAQLRFWRWLYYAFAVIIVLAAIFWLGGYLTTAASNLLASSSYTLPQILLWIANNFDWSAVQPGCFPVDP
jgi:hypothetical protein